MTAQLGPESASDDAEGVMSFWEHLDELRVRLTRAGLSYIVGIFVAWYFKDHLLHILWIPFEQSWIAEKVPGVPELHFAAPGDAFLAYFKLSMIAGLLIATVGLACVLHAADRPEITFADGRIFPESLTSTKDGTLYIGVTSDLLKRIWQHKNKIFEGFSADYGVDKLMWFEQHSNAEAAITHEKQLKKWRRDWKKPAWANAR